MPKTPRKRKKPTEVIDTLAKDPKPILQNEKGHFIKGTGRGPGRMFPSGKSAAPSKEYFLKLRDYRSAIASEISPEDLRAVMRNMIELASSTNMQCVQAARFVYSYAIGEPVRYDFEKLDKEMQADVEKIFDVIPMEKLIELAR